MLVDHLDRLTDAVYTLAAVQIALHEHVSPHQAAIQVAEQRHETRHALASWRPPRDSYRAVDPPRSALRRTCHSSFHCYRPPTFANAGVSHTSCVGIRT